MRAASTTLAMTTLLGLASFALAQDEKKPQRPPQGLPDVNQIFDRFDRNKDGTLDRDECPERLKENFDQLDLNKDGKLSKEEVQKARERFAPRRPDAPPPGGPIAPEPLFRLIDANGDGKLSKEEFQAATEKLRRLDKNGDGMLDREELLAGLRDSDRPRPPGVADRPADPARFVEFMLQRLDENKDGKISKDEAKGPLAEGFDRADTNKDGFLDKEELKAAAGRLRPPGAGPRPGGEGGALDRPARPAASFDDLDKNADGRLTKEEVKGTPLADKFDQIDTNKDGKIDPKEFAAYMQKK